MTTAKRQPIAPDIFRSTHFNVLLPSLAMGGAERSVVETLQGLSKSPATAKLFVMNDVKPAYDCEGIAHTKVYRLQGMDLETKLRTVAFETLASPTPVVFTHMVHAQHLRPLWRLGVFTIPVIQNSRPSWQDEPSAFNDPQVPFVVAVSEDVAEQLRAAGCPKPVIALRHELQRWFTAEELQAQRRKIRELHAVPDNTLLIGMVGEFKSQKAYTRAVRVLAEIRQHQNAKLMILGGWDHHWGNGRAAFTAACKQALDLGVMPDLLTPGPVKDVGPYYAAFDVFLNTSIYEGLSVAALEAVNAGCLIVSADAGGNRECLPPDAVIVRDSSDISAYVSGIAQVLSKGHRLVPAPPPDLDLVPRLWSMLGQYGVSDLFPENQNKDGVLFLSDNLNLGGAPRSLVNLLCGLPRDGRTWLGVLHSINHQAFLDELESAGVPVFSLRSASGYLDHVEQILAMVRRTGAGTVVFWNVNARVKLLLAKVLAQARIKLIDVSPGPWLFEDMDQQIDFQRRITFYAPAYFERLDHFVSKYKGGYPPGLALPARKLSVIPNGVPPMTGNAQAGKHLKRGKDREFLIGTCCRIMPSKRIDYFVSMLAELNQLLPGVKMTLVGAAHPQYEDYWRSIQKLIRELGVTNLHFAGPQADVASYLRQFEVFIMLGTDHGCPNASLEAMSAGLPIVAARHGGTREQVIPGVNGFLVSDQNPKEMARRVRTLLLNPAMRRKFGQAGRKIVNQKFSMDLMVERYSQLLGITKKGKKNRPQSGGVLKNFPKESIKPLPNP
jgi:glycosyltransferase involved in cell wall biosynthesis